MKMERELKELIEEFNSLNLDIKINYKNHESGELLKYYDNGAIESRKNFKNYKLDGLSEGYYKSGKIRYIGNYKDDKLEGILKEYYENGKLKSEKNFKNHKLDGLIKIYYENGELKDEINYKDGKPNGLCESYYENGKIKNKINYKEGLFHGLCRAYYNNGKLKKEENLKNGKRQGLCKSYYENGNINKEYNYKEGEFHGLCRDYYENGNIKFEGNYKDGKRYDLYRAYFENGKLDIEFNYKEDKREGVCKEYHENGNIKFEDRYKEDKLDGISREYYENTKLKNETYYNEGKKDGISKGYYKNGQLEFKHNYKEDKLDGICKNYYESGGLKTEYSNREGKLDGICKNYYESGELKSEYSYKEGKLDGISKNYCESGELKSEYSYKEDKLNGISKRYYESGELEYENNYKEDKLNGISKRYYKHGQLYYEKNYKDGKKHGLTKGYYESGELEYENNYKEGKLNGISKGYYENGQLDMEYNYKNDKEEGICKGYYEDGNLEFEYNYREGKKYSGKNFEYFKENNQEIVKINYYICDCQDNEIVYQEDYKNISSNLIIRKNYLILNGKRICFSKKLINNMKEIQVINDNIKLQINSQYIKLDKNYYNNIYSYADIIGKIEIKNREIFYEREFIKMGKLNGLKVLYKNNNGEKEYIDIELYENNIKIEDSLEDRKRMISQYLISNEEKEEWINIPFKIAFNNNNMYENKIQNNFKETKNKLLYMIISISLFIILGGALLYKQFSNKNEYVTVYYSQPKKEEVKQNQNVVENKNVNKYVPTANDAKYIKYNNYYNNNYDYSMDYPDDNYFKISANYENGMEMRNDNGEVYISLSYDWDENGENLQEAYNRAVSEKPNAPYKFLGKTFFTITYPENGLLIFRKTVYDKVNGKYIYLYVSFPPEYKEYMTPIVEKMANSMKKHNTNVSYNNDVDSDYERKFGRVVNDKYVGGSFIEFLKNADQNEYYYLRDQFWEILDTMYITQDNKTYYYLNDIINQLETKADKDPDSRVIFLEVKGNKLYYTVGFPKEYNANTPSWIQFEIFERKFKDGIGLRTAHVSCAINGVEYKDWEAIEAIYR